MYYTKRWQTWLIACWLHRRLFSHWRYGLARWCRNIGRTVDVLNIYFRCNISLWLVHLLMILGSLYIESAWETPRPKSRLSLKLLLADLSWCNHLLSWYRCLYNLRILDWFKALHNCHVSRLNMLFRTLYDVRDHWRCLRLLSFAKGRLCLRLV